MGKLGNVLKAIRLSLRGLAASGALASGQAETIAKGIDIVEHGLKTKNHKHVAKGVNEIARALLRNETNHE